MTTWDFNHCIECKRFQLRRGKGLNNWACKLNNENAKERRAFGEIWACKYLNERGLKIKIPEVVIIYVGKRKKNKKP